MELQEKANVPIFTDVDKEIFLRDIYPQVTSMSNCLYVCFAFDVSGGEVFNLIRGTTG